MKKKKRMSEKRVKLMALLMKITDFLLIGLISLVCSLPLVTFGAAAAAAYTIGVSMIRGEEGSIYKAYFRVFKEQFRHVTPTWLVLLLLIVLLIANTVFYFYLSSAGAVWAQFGLGVCAIAALALSFVGAFLFPILAKNDDMLGRDAIKISAFLAGKQIGWWALKTIVQGALLALTWFFPYLWIIVPGALVSWNSFCYDRAFKRQFPKKPEESANSI